MAVLMIEHSCKGMTLGDHSAEICTICGADLKKSTYNELLETIKRVRELHEIYYNGTACSCCEGQDECVHCGWNYPCPTIQALDGK